MIRKSACGHDGWTIYNYGYERGRHRPFEVFLECGEGSEAGGSCTVEDMPMEWDQWVEERDGMDIRNREQYPELFHATPPPMAPGRADGEV